MQKLNVGFVFGGDSAESDVSVISMLIMEKTVRKIIDIEPYYLYLSKQNEFYLIDKNDMVIDTFKEENVKRLKNKIELLKGAKVCIQKGLKRKYICIDTIINVTHGGVGENGVLSGYFELLKIKNSTYNHTALGVCMDKNLFKNVARGLNILVPDFTCFSKKEWEENRDYCIDNISALKLPLVVKPNASGSSLGVTVIKDFGELEEAVSVAFEFDNRVIVEKFIMNKVEFNCAVLGDENEVIVSDVDQVLKDSELFSFQDKYIGSSDSAPTKNELGSKMGGKSLGMEGASLLPAPIGAGLTKKIQDISAKLFSELGLSGIVRVDFLYDKNKKKLYVGEINSIPGSMALYFFQKSSIGSVGVIKKLIDIGLASQNNKVKIDSKFIPKIF